jgi:cytochrome oxidase Cu insertion factor (SCO1/SenC/PrrC family)
MMKWALASVVVALFTLGALAAAFNVGGGNGGAPAGQSARYRGTQPPAVIRLPDFALRSYTGESIRGSDLRGKVLLVTFLDSQCTESCPVIASQIGRAIDLLTSDERRRVEAIAISTDPVEDTPESVRSFLGKQRAVGRLDYLVGPEDEMRLLWTDLNILSSLETGEDTLHSAPVRVYDQRGVWVSTLHPGVDLRPENLVNDVRVALATG